MSEHQSRSSVRKPTESAGPLAGHVKDGRRFLPSLVATGTLQIGDWVRDDLPDLLWPVLVLAEYGTSGARRFVGWQKDVQQDLAGRADPQFIADCLDGRLTGLDRLAQEVHEAQRAVVGRANERGLIPSPTSRALATYPKRPATWLIDRDFAPPTQADIDLLARGVLEVLTDGHREAVIKCLFIWSAVQARTLSTSHETIELLRTYPEDEATRGTADSVVRAMWNANRSAVIYHEASRFDASVEWATVFWGTNSITTRCVRKRVTAPEHETDDADPGADGQGDEQAYLGAEELRLRAMDLTSSYVEALETAPAQRWDPERQEVHAGLVSRAARDVIAVLSAPDLWCAEHGAHVSRMLVELRIVLRWMAVQDDPFIYKKYKDYGAGKAKLYSRVMAEVVEEWLLPEAGEAVEELQRLSHNDEIIDHRIVDLRSTFAEGKTLREMADDCGLLDLYRYGYQLNSGIAHSEWWSIEMHCMERCGNVLHRGHLIPSLSLSAGANEDLARSWLVALYGLIRESLGILSINAESIDAAFAWLTQPGEEAG